MLNWSLGPWQYTTAGLSLALAISLAWGARVDSLRAQHRAALETTIARYEAVQAKAQSDFDAKIAAMQAENRRLNDDADRKAADATIVYRDRVVRLPSAPASCVAGSADMPAADVPESGNGPGGDSVILARTDALICATNTARLEAVREWSLGMNGGNND